MIPVEPFVKPAKGTREYNAVQKALKEKPEVIPVVEGFGAATYKVKQYEVKLWRDADDQCFVECTCAAGCPPIDLETNLPSREANPCYHAASVLLHIAEKENEDGIRAT